MLLLLDGAELEMILFMYMEKSDINMIRVITQNLKILYTLILRAHHELFEKAMFLYIKMSITTLWL